MNSVKKFVAVLALALALSLTTLADGPGHSGGFAPQPTPTPATAPIDGPAVEGSNSDTQTPSADEAFPGIIAYLWELLTDSN